MVRATVGVLSFVCLVLLVQFRNPWFGKSPCPVWLYGLLGVYGRKKILSASLFQAERNRSELQQQLDDLHLKLEETSGATFAQVCCLI